MDIDEERLEMIRANAVLVVREMADLSGAAHGFTSEGVAWITGFIERQRLAITPDNSRGLVNVLGCYLGEAIIAAVPGAEWAEDPNGALGIVFPNGDMAFPFSKVEKQLADGLESGESVLSFYNISVNYVAAGKLGEAAREEAP
jgi:hypothetical protein